MTHISYQRGSSKVIVKPVGKCPSGWDAYRGCDEFHKGFYYIRQPNMFNQMTWYRCSKDWEPSYECNPVLFIINKQGAIKMSSDANRKAVTIDRCLDWCLMAYAETRTRGYFIASRFEIPSTEQLLPPATQAGLVLEDKQAEGKRPRKVWHDILKVPNKTDAKKLFDAYQAYQEAARRKHAEKIAKSKPLTTKAKLQVVANGKTTKDYLIRIETKLDQLLELWGEKK
jgi:hypothetical protein